MKRTLLSILFLSLAILGYSQIVITEIMYNPPESDTDSLEYIEIYNNGTDAVDLSGYHFSDGIIDTVEAGVSLDAGSYHVFCVNARAMATVYNITADEWSGGALKNGGEAIILRDPMNAIVDSVEYADDGDWPSEDDGTDSEGASIELCDYNSDNADGNNWRAADNDLGIELNTKAVKGTPGAANTVVCESKSAAIIESFDNNTYAPADVTINVGETVTWANVSGFHNVNGNQGTFPDNPESFGNGAASSDTWTFDYTFNIAGVYDYQCDPHAGFGMAGTVTVIDPNANLSYPTYGIGFVTGLDSDGVADSLGINCTLGGIVHGINFNPNGLTFTLIEPAGPGIGVYSGGDNFGYSVNEGDDILIEGTITQFNGLLQIEPVSITLSGSSSAFAPTEVTVLDESTESQLVVLTGIDYVDVNQWIPDGSGFNIDVTDGTNVNQVRIDSDTEMFAWMEPQACAGSLSIIGLGGQFDQNAPYDSGYQLFPRYASDIMCSTNTEENFADISLTIYPNPGTQFINVDTDFTYDKYQISDAMGRVVLSGNYENQINVTALDAGIYHLVFRKGDSTFSKLYMKK